MTVDDQLRRAQEQVLIAYGTENAARVRALAPNKGHYVEVKP